jgi:hypothetical protein
MVGLTDDTWETTKKIPAEIRARVYEGDISF